MKSLKLVSLFINIKQPKTRYFSLAVCQTEDLSNTLGNKAHYPATGEEYNTINPLHDSTLKLSWQENQFILWILMLMMVKIENL